MNIRERERQRERGEKWLIRVTIRGFVRAEVALCSTFLEVRHIVSARKNIKKKRDVCEKESQRERREKDTEK